MRITSFRLVAAVTLAAVALAACESGSARPQDTPPSPFDPAAAAKWLRARGGAQITGETKVAKLSGPIAGRINYDPYAVDSALSVAASSTELARVRYRRTGDTAWIKRQVPKQSTTAELTFAVLVYHAPASPPFLETTTPDAGVFGRLATPFDPVLLLEQLARAGVAFSPMSDAAVAGVSRRRYRARLGTKAASATGLRAATVAVSARNRPVGIAFETLIGGRTEYEVRDFSGPLAVVPPPAEQVEVTGQGPPDAIGPYVTVVTATIGSTAVTISRADADRGWECWKVESVPAFVGIEAPLPSGGYCSVPVTASRSDNEAFAVPLDAAGSLPYELLGIVFPSGTTASITTLAGQQPMAVSPQGLAYYADTAADVALLVEATTPDGTKLVCGPGSINNLAGVAAVLADLAETALGAETPDPSLGGPIRGQPWNCLPEDLANLLGAPGF